MRSNAARWLLAAVLVSGVALAADVFTDTGSNNGNYTAIGTDNHIAKPFTAPASALVTHLEVQASTVTGLGSGCFMMELREDDAGVPGALLAFGEGDAGSSGSMRLVRVPLFPTDVFLDGGSRFWAVMHPIGGDGGMWITWKRSVAAAEQLAESYDGGAGWDLISESRLWLKVIGTYTDAPIAVDDEYFILEDQPQFQLISPSVRVNDTPSSGPQIIVVGFPQNAVLSMQQDGRFSLNNLPPDYFGEQDFQYILDAGLVSNPATVRVFIQPVNDPPVFTKGPDVVVDEDSPIIDIGWALNAKPGPANESTQGMWVQTLSVSAPELFEEQPQVGPTGRLTFKPAPNRTGSALIAIRAFDDGGTANGGIDQLDAGSFRIDVTQVNDPPFFDGGSNVVTYNDEATVTVFRWAGEVSPGELDPPQALTFDATTDKPEAFQALPTVTPLGDLIFDPMPDAGGFANVTVVLHDDGAGTDGGALQSPPYTFTIEFQDPPPKPDSGTTIIIVEVDGGQQEPRPPPKPRGHYACASAPGAQVLGLLPLLFLALRRRNRSA